MNDKELFESIINTLSIEAGAISNLISNISSDQVLKIIKLIGECKGRVIVAGCGTSGVAAKKIVHTLCCVERPACFLCPSDAVHGELGLLQKEDILILISKGGKTSELANLIPACKKKGAKLIVVTENMDSILAREADIVLKIKVNKEACPFNMLATASTLSVIAVFDAVSIALMHYTHYTKEQFLVIHSGGDVGERLMLGKE